MARVGPVHPGRAGRLTIADAVTTVSERHLTADEYDLLREDLTDDQLALLVYAATMINGFNRISILSHHPVTYRESFGAPVQGGHSWLGRATRVPLVDVTDNRELCIHSGVCVQGLAAVFDTQVVGRGSTLGSPTRPTSPSSCVRSLHDARQVPYGSTTMRGLNSIPRKVSTLTGVWGRNAWGQLNV